MQPVLFEVNFVPDTERLCKTHPDFLNDCFSALFLEDYEPGTVTILQQFMNLSLCYLYPFWVRHLSQQRLFSHHQVTELATRGKPSGGKIWLQSSVTAAFNRDICPLFFSHYIFRVAISWDCEIFVSVYGSIYIVI